MDLRVTSRSPLSEHYYEAGIDVVPILFLVGVCFDSYFTCREQGASERDSLLPV